MELIFRMIWIYSYNLTQVCNLRQVVRLILSNDLIVEKG
ncbi:MAG: hypothetical protein RLZZ628_802 [Bacteroidota bacterium]|jgi:hypothetical protein